MPLGMKMSKYLAIIFLMLFSCSEKEESSERNMVIEQRATFKAEKLRSPAKPREYTVDDLDDVKKEVLNSEQAIIEIKVLLDSLRMLDTAEPRFLATGAMLQAHEEKLF